MTINQQLLNLAEEIAIKAGEMLMKRPSNFELDQKSGFLDFATQMDHESEKLIVGAILSARPDDGIIGEEGADRPSKSGYTWVIDPIDGTVNYFYNMPGWSVSIAVKDQSGTVVGVVYAPTINSLFTAIRGGGAFENGEPLKCNNPIELNRALIATGFHYVESIRSQQIAQFNKLILNIRDYRRNGSAAVDICHVAAGVVDGYYEMGLKEWDLAAAELIAKEAGAIVSIHGELTIAAGAHLHGILSGQLLD